MRDCSEWEIAVNERLQWMRDLSEWKIGLKERLGRMRVGKEWLIGVSYRLEWLIGWSEREMGVNESGVNQRLDWMRDWSEWEIGVNEKLAWMRDLSEWDIEVNGCEGRVQNLHKIKSCQKQLKRWYGQMMQFRQRCQLLKFLSQRKSFLEEPFFNKV
jgi:hypothetical protein